LVEGRAQVSAERILDILDIEHGMPILAIDPEGVRRRLVELGWIATAEVTRRLPNTIYVRITERQPAAIWQQGGQLALIDPGGTVITREGLEAFADLPHVVGLGAEAQVRALLAALEGFPELGEDIAAAVWVSQRRWDLVLTGGTKVRLPEGDISTALSHLIEMKRDYAVMEKNVVSIDLRIEDRLIVRLPGDEGAAVGPESDPVITIPQKRPNSPQDMPGDSRRQDT
ncbi:MAG: cell division protein FtsQ/DivIB, partial [Alphaproteobacteria bacterium]|nr:cell division protein FtsQ/DivIB [Alphaproteobacteria bacterium]